MIQPIEESVFRNRRGCESFSVGYPVFDSASFAFIIRFMVEPNPNPGQPGEWKGMIQHVASGEQRFFRDINEIPGLLVQLLRIDRRVGENKMAKLKGMTPKDAS